MQIAKQEVEALLKTLPDIRTEKERRWAQDHAPFIAAYNQTVEAEGLALAQWRTF